MTNKKAAQAASASAAKQKTQAKGITKRGGVYRKVYAGLWNDSRFYALPAEAKAVYLYLLTAPGMTGLGAMRATPEGIAADIGCSADNVREAFGKDYREAFGKDYREAFGKDYREAFGKDYREAKPKAIEEGLRILRGRLVVWDKDARCVWLPGFVFDQSAQSPNVIKSWAPALDYIPDCQLKTFAIQEAAELAETMGEAFREAFREAFGKDLLKDYPKPDSSEQLAVNPIKTPSQDVEMVGVHGGGGGEKSGGFATPAEGGAA